MTVAAFTTKSNAIRGVMNRKVAKRELLYYRMAVNADDRHLEIRMQDPKGNRLKYDITFKETK